MGKITIKNLASVLNRCNETFEANNVSLETVCTAEPKSLSKEVSKAKKELVYATTHLFIMTVDSEGKERKIPATGAYTGDCVILNIDANSYICVVDDCNGGCFIRSYARCSEKSAQYYWKSERTAKCQAINKEDAELLVCGYGFGDLLERVKLCKGFKPATAKRMLEVSSLAVSKAQTSAKNRAKAQERAKAKEA